LNFFNDVWKKEWTDEILIAKEGLTSDNYRMMGEKFITDYYNHYKPFDDMTVLGLETQDRMLLSDGNQYHVRIDKLGCVGDTYYVCDYKTNNRMKDQEEADADRQLAMYSILVKDKFRDAKKVVLKWYMLAFDKEVTSERSTEQLSKLQDDTVALIDEIEKCEEFPTKVTALCNYCVFKSLCPSFKHETELEEKTPKEFKDDDGVRFVDEYAELQAKKKEIEQKLEFTKRSLIQFAKDKDLIVVYGSNMKASVKPYPKVVYPDDKEELINLIKEKGLYDELSSLNYFKLNPKIIKNEIDREIIDMTKQEEAYRVSVSKKREVF